jgi:hypothetical protein
MAFECLREMDVDQLFTIFENSFRAHLQYRAPGQDVNAVLSEARQHTTKEQLLKLARHMPSVVAAATSEGSSGYSSSKGQASRAGSWESQSPAPASNNVKTTSIPPRRHSVDSRGFHTQAIAQQPSEKSPPPPYETAIQIPRGPMSPTVPFSPTHSTQMPITPEAVKITKGPTPTMTIDISTLQLDSTVLNGLYIRGRGRNKTTETPFEVSEENYVRALAWTRRSFAFEYVQIQLSPIISLGLGF